MSSLVRGAAIRRAGVVASRQLGLSGADLQTRLLTVIEATAAAHVHTANTAHLQ